MKTTPETTLPSITDRLKGGYTAACEILNREILTIDSFAALPEAQRNAFFALHKIHTVIEAINEGHQFDWNNWEEKKWFAWWDMETYGDAPAGSGFAVGGVGYADTGTDVSARLCTRTEEHTRFVAELMLDEYRIWIKG